MFWFELSQALGFSNEFVHQDRHPAASRHHLIIVRRRLAEDEDARFAPLVTYQEAPYPLTDSIPDALVQAERRRDDDRLRLKIRPPSGLDSYQLSPARARQRAILVASIAPRNDTKLSSLPDREQATSIAEEELDLGFAAPFADSVSQPMLGNQL